MSKPKITRQISKYNFSSRNGAKISYIVIHDVGAVSTAKNNADFFGKPIPENDYKRSAHYFVDATSIYQVVEDNNASWHCSGGNRGISNANSIGVEMCLTAQRKVAKATKAKTIELVKVLQEKYNVPNDRVVRHYDATGKNCPASMSAGNWAEWKEFKTAIDGGGTFGNTAKFKSKDLVTVKTTATHYQTGEPVAAFVKGGSFTVKQVKRVDGSFAYLLEPIKSWVLEKDLTAAETASAGASAGAGAGINLKWIAEKAKFTVSVAGGIRVRKEKPSVKAPQSHILKQGQSVNYTRYTQNEGYIWIEFESNGKRYLPVREVGKKAWGKFS